MSDKLVVERSQPQYVQYKCLKIDDVTHSRIQAMSAKAGISMVAMLRKMIDFCEDRIVIKDKEQSR